MLRSLREQVMCLQQLGITGVAHGSDGLQLCPPEQSLGPAWGRPCSHSLCDSRWGGHTGSHCPPPQGQGEEDPRLHTRFTQNLLASGAVAAAQGWPWSPLQAVTRAGQGPAAEHTDAHDAGAVTAASPHRSHPVTTARPSALRDQHCPALPEGLENNGQKACSSLQPPQTPPHRRGDETARKTIPSPPGRGEGADGCSAVRATLLGRDAGGLQEAPGPGPASLAAAREGPGLVDPALERRSCCVQGSDAVRQAGGGWTLQSVPSTPTGVWSLCS